MRSSGFQPEAILVITWAVYLCQRAVPVSSHQGEGLLFLFPGTSEQCVTFGMEKAPGVIFESTSVSGGLSTSQRLRASMRLPTLQLFT